MLDVGTKAPDFTVTAHDGSTVKLSDLSDQRVVLYFYPKADTPGCTAQSCSFRDHSDDIEKLGGVVLGVSFDTVEENRAFAEKFSLPFRLLCDTDRSIGLAYRACDSQDAKYAKRIGYVIENGTITHGYDVADPAGHANKVIGDIS